MPVNPLDHEEERRVRIEQQIDVLVQRQEQNVQMMERVRLYVERVQLGLERFKPTKS
jgi:hypothetical protein